MRENSRQADKRLQHNPLRLHLRTFATSLLEYGYTDGTIHSKLWLLGDLERWLRRTKLAVTHLDEQLLEAFLKHKRRVRRGEPKTLQQFLDHLRKLAIVPGRKVVRDQSPLADILNRYETYLRSERGLVSVTILHYQDFARKFLLERFREGPFRLREVKPSDISDSGYGLDSGTATYGMSQGWKITPRTWPRSRLVLAPRRRAGNILSVCDGPMGFAAGVAEVTDTGECERYSWNVSSVGTKPRRLRGRSFRIPGVPCGCGSGRCGG